MADKQRFAQSFLADYKKILVAAGIGEDRVRTRCSVLKCASIGDAILKEQEALRCCILVLGRRGLSHQEEFVFGSTTSRVLRYARRCAVMVIE